MKIHGEAKREKIRFFLEGTEKLLKVRLIETYKVWQTVDNATGRIIHEELDYLIDSQHETLAEYPLKEIKKAEVISLRHSGKPGFVLKFSSRFFYTKIPYKSKFVNDNLFGNCQHKCSDCSKPAKIEQEGGCPKRYNGPEKIEKYPFISLGFETFNTVSDCMMVAKCKKFYLNPPKRLTPKERFDKKLAIAQFIWPDIEDLADVKKHQQRRGNFTM